MDFCDTLADILRKAKTEQHKNRFKYGELYHLNYYKEVKEKDRTYYEVYSLPRTEEVPDGYKEISFVCLRPDGAYESPSTVGVMTRSAKKKLEGFEDFHFHMLRHPYVKHTTKNISLQKQKSQTTNRFDSLGFLFSLLALYEILIMKMPDTDWHFHYGFSRLLSSQFNGLVY